MKKIITIIVWIIAVISVFYNMALTNEINKLEQENYKLYVEVQSLKEVIE